MRTLNVFLAASLALVAGPGFAQAPETAIDGYGIRLESTVGLSDGCADTPKLSLPAGVHTVVVCLFATNIGDSTLYLHDVVSEQLGILAQGSLYTLPPMESVYYTYAVPLNQTSGLVSRWSGTSAQGVTSCATAWSVVRVGPGLTGLSAPSFNSSLVCPPAAGGGLGQ